MRSLSLRISLTLAASQLALLALATAFAYAIGDRVLTDQFDQDLAARAAAYRALVEQEGTRVGIDGREALALAASAPRELVQIWGPGGHRLFRSAELGERSLPKPRGDVGAVSIAETTFEGKAVRILAVRGEVARVEKSLWSGKAGESAVIAMAIARDSAELRRARAGLLTGLLGGAAVLLVSAVLLARWSARRGLAPLRSFGREVGALDVETLGGSFDPAQHPCELEPVVAGLNDLRGRVDRALRREKRMNATLAHEFRTPISELRAMTSVALQDPSDADFTRRALEQVHRVSGRMAELLGLIRQLVHLAREEPEPALEDVDLGELVAELRPGLQELADARGLCLADGGLDGARVRANRAALASVCANLLGNAVLYAPQGSTVRYGVRSDAGGVVLGVSNPCHDLSADQVERLTEPFWRGSTSRSDPDRHGLGLSIASEMAALAGLGLRLSLRDATFVAEVLFPGAGLVSGPCGPAAR